MFVHYHPASGLRHFAREMGIAKAVEGVLVVAFLAEVVGCVLVAGRAPGCPLSPNAAAAALVASNDLWPTNAIVS